MSIMGDLTLTVINRDLHNFLAVKNRKEKNCIRKFIACLICIAICHTISLPHSFSFLSQQYFFWVGVGGNIFCQHSRPDTQFFIYWNRLRY